MKVGTTSYSNTSVKGVSESYLGMSGCTVRVGRGINYVDLTDNKKICVVGDHISRVAYGGNAVGQTIKNRSGEIYHCGRTGSQGDRHLGSGGQQR